MFSSHNLTGVLISDIKLTKKGYRSNGSCKTWNRWSLACTKHVSMTGNDGNSSMRDHGTFTSYRFEFENGPYYLICCKSTVEKEINPDIHFEITSYHIPGGFRIKLTPAIPFNQEYDLYCISEEFFRDAESEVPETEVPETEVPKTEVSENPKTEVPETEVPENPKTEVPETEVPENPETRSP